MNELGSAVRAALEVAGKQVPHPSEWVGHAQPLYDSAGVKGWSAFVRGALFCTVDGEGGHLRFTPYANRGAREGFVPLDHDSIVLPGSASSTEIGETVAQAIELAARR